MLLLLLGGCAGDAVVRRGDVLVLVALLVIVLLVARRPNGAGPNEGSMRPSASGLRLFLDQLFACALRPHRRPRSSASAPRRRASQVLAPVCMTKCMAAPSQAFAHSLGSAAARRPQRDQPRGAGAAGEQQQHGAEHEERRARPRTTTAASGRNGPMTCAPAMKKSPRMPPSPLGSGQLFGWGRAASGAASRMTAAGQASSRSRRRVRAPCGRRGASPRRRAAGTE